jgi:hypothetical protein
MVVLADFGECLDFKATGLTEMKQTFNIVGLSRGGAPTYMAPEIASTIAGAGIELNYDKGKFNCFANANP